MESSIPSQVIERFFCIQHLISALLITHNRPAASSAADTDLRLKWISARKRNDGSEQMAQTGIAEADRLCAVYKPDIISPVFLIDLFHHPLP